MAFRGGGVGGGGGGGGASERAGSEFEEAEEPLRVARAPSPQSHLKGGDTQDRGAASLPASSLWISELNCMKQMI